MAVTQQIPRVTKTGTHPAKPRKLFVNIPVRDLQRSIKFFETLGFTFSSQFTEVDEMLRKALAAGGANAAETQDHGFMYQSSFCDPDGHHWEVFWMDPAVINN